MRADKTNQQTKNQWHFLGSLAKRMLLWSDVNFFCCFSWALVLFFILAVALLKYNSYITQLIHLKSKIQCFLVYSECCNDHHDLFYFIFYLFLISFFFYGRTHSIWNFPGWELNPRLSYHLCRSYSNTNSFNPLCQPGIEPGTLQWPQVLQSDS